VKADHIDTAFLRGPSRGDVEALVVAEAMVARYEYRVSLHPESGPTTQRERTEASNLEHWRRRLDAIELKTHT
jgi:hypothetical protein